MALQGYESFMFFIALFFFLHYGQTSMSATLQMEVVNRSVPMLLVALPATVRWGTCWMEMDSTALVSSQ